MIQTLQINSGSLSHCLRHPSFYKKPRATRHRYPPLFPSTSLVAPRIMVAVNSLLQRWAITAAASGYWGAYQDCASNCDLSNVQISLPSAQLTTLGQPNSSHPVAVAVAFGVQNYTCSANNNFTYVCLLAYVNHPTIYLPPLCSVLLGLLGPSLNSTTFRACTRPPLLYSRRSNNPCTKPGLT